MSSVSIATLKPAPGVAQAVLHGHAATLEAQRRERVRRRHVDALGDLEPAGALRPRRTRSAPSRRALRRCARPRCRSRRCRRSRSRSWFRRGRMSLPSSLALVVDRRNVGARLRLGQRERCDPLTAGDPRQVAPLQLFAAVQGDRAAAQSLHGESEVGEPRVTRQGLADQAQASAIRAAPARRRRRPGRCSATSRPALDARPASRQVLSTSPPCCMSAKLLRSPLFEVRNQLTMRVVEERPVEIGFVAHDDAPSPEPSPYPLPEGEGSHFCWGEGDLRGKSLMHPR